MRAARQIDRRGEFSSSLVTVFPLTTPGHATGGGQIPNDVSFGFQARSDDKGITANCTVVDRMTDTKIKCLDATSFAQTADHVTFSGRALVNGVETGYTIDLDDNGEPGRGSDTFKIVTLGGYSAAGVLTEGNVQAHAE